MLPPDVARMVGCLRPYRWPIGIAVFVYVVGLVGGNVVGALELRYLVDAIDRSSWRFLVLFWWLYAIDTLVVPVFMAFNVYLMGLGVQGALRDIRTRVFAKALRGTRPNHDGHRTAAVISALVNDANLLGDAITGQVPSICSAVVGVFIALGIVATWNWLPVVLIAVFTFIVLQVNSRYARAMNRAVSSQQEALAQVLDSSSSAIGGYLVVRSLGAERAWLSRYAGVVGAHLSAVRRRGRVQAVVSVTLSASGVMHRTVELVAALMVLRGRLTAGMAPAIAQLGSQVVSPAMQLGANWTELQAGVVASDRIHAVLDEVEPAGRAADDADRCGAALTATGLSYTYQGQPAPAVRDCSFVIPAGQVVALVGSSGCGKSTLLKLLLGLYPEFEGRLSCAGAGPGPSPAPVRMSCCPQDLQLFRTSVRDNLEMVIGAARGEAAGDEVARDDAALDGKAWYARYDARVGEVIESFDLHRMSDQLKACWDTPTGELSGGQRQRVAVTRAFLPAGAAVLLDEPTGHLDITNEHIVYDAIRKVRGAATVVIATHRVVNLDWVDRILVMGDGEIIEDGTYAELVEGNGAFAALHRKQSRTLPS
jgi:ABC-type multidrug transport system fused ATPase/permease subunit